MQEVGPLERGASGSFGLKLRKFRDHQPALGDGGALWGRGHRPRGQTQLCLDAARGATWRGEGSAWRGLFRGADELGVEGWGKELRGRASPAEGGSGRRGVRARRWKRRPRGGLAVVQGPLGLVSPGGEGGRWGGPLSEVGECSGQASLATEGFGGTGVTGGEGTGRCEGPLPARSSGRAPPEVKGSSG